MAGFATWQELKNALHLNAQEVQAFVKMPSTNPSSARWTTYWPAGGMPDTGTTSSGALVDGVGGVTFAATGSVGKYLLRGQVTAPDNVALMVYDRLVQVTGLDFTSTGDKTVNSAALPRYADGFGVVPLLEVATIANLTSVTFSMSSYTNEAGTSGRAGPSYTISNLIVHAAGETPFLPVQSGDLGVRSVETINVSSASGGGGFALTVNLVLARLLGCVTAQYRDLGTREFFAQLPAFARVYDGATLSFLGFRWPDALVAANAGVRGLLEVVRG